MNIQVTTQKAKLNPGTPVADAARLSLSRNFRKVRRLLKLAALFADDDIEYVHQLRISSRRTIAALNVFREFLPAKRWETVAKQVTDIRRVAADARDLDVSIGNQTTDTDHDRQVLKRLRKKRKKSQKPIVALYRQSRLEKTLRKDCRKLLKALDQINSSNQPRFSEWAKLKLEIYVARFFSQRPDDVSDLRQFHRLRIEAKKFRYVLDALAPAFPAGSFDEVLPKIKRLQNELGKINDSAVAISQIHRMKKQGLKIDKRIIRKKQAELNASLQNFTEGWTSETEGELLNEMRRQLGKTERGGASKPGIALS